MNDAEPVNFGFTIDIPVVGEWDNVDMVRLSLQTCVATLFQSLDYRHTLGMVAGELLENAVKYANRPSELTVFRVRIYGTVGQGAYVQVSNPAEPEGARRVLDTIARLRQAASPADAYRQRMLDIAASPSRMSRLGLLRIAYEGGCTLDAEIADDTLTVTATVPCAA